MNSIFEQFPNQLEEAYNLLLKGSFSNDFWKEGKYKTQRINWKDAYKAKKVIPEFQKSGLYIWGHEKIPIYLGKAETQSLVSRFGRYAFGTRCQCAFAEKYSEILRNGGKERTTLELKDEFKIQSMSRALGSKTFGEVGSDKIWFILIPVKEEFISNLETELIDIAEKWNLSRGYDDLINLERIKKNNIKK